MYVHVVRCCDNTADALTTTTTIGKEVEDSCVGSLIEPCLQSKGLSLQTVSKKDCIAAAVSGGSVCQISSDSCFKTFYNLCQTAR